VAVILLQALVYQLITVSKLTQDRREDDHAMMQDMRGEPVC
jgi:hypothetical protein